MHSSRRPGSGKTQTTMRDSKSDVTMDNADSRMGNFMKYYKGIGLVPEDEWDNFMKTSLTAPPVVFRFVQQHRLSKNVLEGNEEREAHSEILRNYMKKTILPKLAKTEINGKQVDVQPLSWYPEELAYRINFTAPDLRNYGAFKDMSEFLVSETSGFNVLRQEVSSMLPTLLLDIQPHHKILDMCTAPGWKAAQMAEKLYAGTVDQQTDGFLVANDMESNRIQWRWTQGTSSIFMKNDARYLPDLFINEEYTEENKLAFDRILCDVPCSKDGSIRKNINLRGQWQLSTGLNNHKTQKKLLQRGLELLAVGGKLLYCTNSMNPVENEAVVLAMLMLAPNSLELVDVSDLIPGFKYDGGLTSWKVMGSTGEFYESMEEASESFKNQYEDTLFPPPPEMIDDFNMERCVRVLPHHNDTEGFFCAVIQKKGSLPWAVAKVPSDVSKSTDKGKVDESGDSKKVKADGETPEKKIKYVSDRPLRIVTNVSVSMLEWETTTTDEKGEEVVTVERQEFDVPPIRVAPERRYGSQKDDKDKKEVEEDLYNFMEPESEAWLKVKEFYQISDDFDPSVLNLRVNQSVWYMTTPFLKTLMISNKDRRNVKLMKNFGLKCFAQYKHKLTTDCDMVLSNQGIMVMFPHIGARKVVTTKKDMLQLIAHKSVQINKLSQQTQDQLQEITPGCIVLHYTPSESDPEPNSDIVFVGWRDENWVSDHIGSSKYDTAHFARLFGMELQDLKKELKTADDENTTSVKLEIMGEEGGLGATETEETGEGEKEMEAEEEEDADLLAKVKEEPDDDEADENQLLKD